MNIKLGKYISWEFRDYWIKLILIFLVIVFIFLKINKKQKRDQISMEAAQTVNEELVEEQESNSPGTYLVSSGDSLSKIANNIYNEGNYWVEIAEKNNITNPDIIYEGQELILPDLARKGEILTGVSIEAILDYEYEVKEGDCLWEISERAYGDPRRFMEIGLENNLINYDHIEVGWVLSIPRNG